MIIVALLYEYIYIICFYYNIVRGHHLRSAPWPRKLNDGLDPAKSTTCHRNKLTNNLKEDENA
jgi:hypothetical protein